MLFERIRSGSIRKQVKDSDESKDSNGEKKRRKKVV